MTSEEVQPTQINKTVPESPSSFPSLPDEIIENILARVTRWKYPSLSLVSKGFHSLLSSREIYKTRSQIGANETCVYVWLKLPGHPCASWFSLRTKPNNQNQTKQRRKMRFKRDPSGFSVVPIASSPTDSFPELYYTKTVDDRARKHANTVVLDEKIYVMGGCDIDAYYANWIEVFDVKTQSWAAFPGPGVDELCNHFRKRRCYNVNVFEGRIYLLTGDKEYTYEPKDGTWKLVKEISSFLSDDSVEAWCEIGKVICCRTRSGYLMWSASENEGRVWREIKGLKKLRRHPTRGLKIGYVFALLDCGGKLLVMWDPYCISGIRSKKIWYAKISLESRCNGREVWGKVDCVDVLTFPVESYEGLDCLTASV
ncbi:hypothetical protein F2Q70_00033271 [Brassica cretica]|uniref:F-box domain-containing protein n=1 Tax=Brassica cretica TaxID=69181 RepID=A0A8S9FKZ6_BRACR|nr:hypothetical protein F2Q70_00033271 [Brassica cretica]KAF2552072.1 hypothetical protein F2Q68_00037586 [Brassica cretica]